MEASNSSIEILEVASVDSNDAALVTAKKAKFQDFDKANPGDVRSHPTLRLKGQLRARELVELRKMVEGDERFALLLDRHTKAVQELIVNKNSAPVLAMLAGLVWSSLCIAWELDTSHMPKARMKMEVEQLRIKLHKVVEDLSDSRAKYLKELTAHRDKLRHFESLAVAEVRRLIWEEEPVMFYEPIHYLDETTREHVAEITEEKLKLLLKRLQMSVPDDVKTLVAEVDLPQRSRSRQRAKTTALEKLQEFPDIAEEAEELKEKAVSLARREREADQREVRLKNQMEEMRAARRKAEGELTTRLEEEEARHSKTQMLAAEFKAQHLQSQAELSSIVKTLRHEWQELAAGASEAPDLDACALLTQFLRLQSQVLEPKKGSGEKELKEVTRLQGEVVQAQQLQARAEWQLNQLQAENQQLQEKVQQLKAQAEAVSDSCPHCGRKKGEASVTPVNISFQAEPSHQEVKASAEVDKEPVAHGALRAEPSHQQVKASAAVDKESAISASAAKAPSEVTASAEVDKEPVAHGALGAEPSHQQESAISASAARAPWEVKASAAVDKEPVAHGALRAEPSHQQESAISASAAKAPSEVTERTMLTEEPNGGIFATEVNVGYSPGQGAENQALRREVARLERVLNDVQEQLRIVQCQGGAARELACWQSPGYHISKVHERLYLDASNRQERKKALQESTQQARECEVLGMFRSQHPWINALAQSEPQSHCPVPGGASAVEADVWVKPKKPASAGRKRLLPSPRSPSQATDSVGPEGTASPHEYLPLVVSSLTGDEQTARPRPRSASAAMGQVSRPRLSHVRGLPLQHCPSQVAARRPASAASALDQRTMQEGLRLLATKPGQVPLTRPRSVGSLRCLL